ncbi:MAG: hypothetical protein JWO85_3394, partial [Candidatus Eremiobacteraeota bacterium]|nr:hypothetical protein [Candidatus Eremiobacteraeota bacterium]
MRDEGPSSLYRPKFALRTLSDKGARGDMVIESLVIRAATSGDVGIVAVLARRTRMLALPFLPVLHTIDEDMAFFYEVVFPRDTVLIAQIGDVAAGFIAYGGGWVDHLYVDPVHHGRGIGRVLLERAQRAEDELQLWCFQDNPRALRFYS